MKLIVKASCIVTSFSIVLLLLIELLNFFIFFLLIPILLINLLVVVNQVCELLHAEVGGLLVSHKVFHAILKDRVLIKLSFFVAGL